MQSGACPGKTKNGARRSWPFAEIVSTSSVLMPSRAAVAGAISAALSQVSRVKGRGISNSHALSANRPSHSSGSGRKSTEMAPSVGAGGVQAGRKV